MWNYFFTVISTEWLHSKLGLFILRTFRGEALMDLRIELVRRVSWAGPWRDPTAKAKLLTQLYCSRKDSLPQTRVCAEVRMINMGTQQSSLSTHIPSGGMGLFSKICQMEKGRKQSYYEYMFYLCWNCLRSAFGWEQSLWKGVFRKLLVLLWAV